MIDCLRCKAVVRREDQEEIGAKMMIFVLFSFVFAATHAFPAVSLIYINFLTVIIDFSLRGSSTNHSLFRVLSTSTLRWFTRFLVLSVLERRLIKNLMRPLESKKKGLWRILMHLNIL